MIENHYLIQDGYTLAQKKAMERERIAIVTLCAIKPRTFADIANVLGIFHAQRLLEDLRKEGYLIRFHHSPTGQTRYKTNPESISAKMFFMESKLK